MLAFVKHVGPEGVPFWWVVFELMDHRVEFDFDGPDYQQARLSIWLKREVREWLEENIADTDWQVDLDGNELILYLERDVDVVAFQLVWG